MENILSVAQYIFAEYKRLSGDVIDEMKLHKLLYLSQRESFAVCGEAMFADAFEGWKYGPVNRKVRSAYTEDGIFSREVGEISSRNQYIVSNVIQQYGAYASWKLSELSHQEISWRNARKGIPDGQNGDKEMALEDI